MVPPVAVQLTPIGTSVPSLWRPTAENCCWSPPPTVAADGVSSTPTSVGCGGTTMTTAVSGGLWGFPFRRPRTLNDPVAADV